MACFMLFYMSDGLLQSSVADALMMQWQETSPCRARV